ncbi:MAG TPA: glycosyltransferase family 9 protein [Steroidobacteraceae bacterium]|jgi:heptosyltransferase I|nr:glycosyltransferase family 9 protein [Steroidobacteraceae bacterium]
MDAPEKVCLLRLSAIGDTCHVVPLLRTLQDAWPRTRFTWVIGKLEAKLMSVIPDVELITVDKAAGLSAFTRLRTEMRRRGAFDLLLHLQLSARASAAAACIRAPIKVGFDRQRARELQWLFTNRRIEPRSREHVLDSFMGFARALGITPGPPRWDVPLPPTALAYAEQLIPSSTKDAQPTLVISACSSHRARNWLPGRYAAVAEHAVRKHGMRVILCGGPAAIERDMAAEIAKQASVPLIDQVGKDTLPQLLALLARATVLLTPDSGPAHMATMVETPVIGLYAATNPQRSGPYESRRWCVNAYDDAARKFLGKPAAELPWTRKIELPGVMELIEVTAVCNKLDQLLALLG